MHGDGSQAQKAQTTGAAPDPKPRQREAKGRRPYFLKDPDTDRLLAMITALVAEVSVVRERLDTAERLAGLGLTATPENIEAYRPDPTVETAREAMRDAMLHRVYRILMSERTSDADEPSYDAVVKQFS